MEALRVLQVVDDAPRRGHDDVRPLRQCDLLLDHVHAAHDHQRPHVDLPRARHALRA
jgi:hypothetical protein